MPNIVAHILQPPYHFQTTDGVHRQCISSVQLCLGCSNVSRFLAFIPGQWYLLDGWMAAAETVTSPGISFGSIFRASSPGLVARCRCHTPSLQESTDRVKHFLCSLTAVKQVSVRVRTFMNKLKYLKRRLQQHYVFRRAQIQILCRQWTRIEREEFDAREVRAVPFP